MAKITETVDEKQVKHIIGLFADKQKTEQVISDKIAGIAKQFRSTRDNITQACAAIAIYSAQHKSSKWMNALIDAIANEKQDATARAVITWACANGFKKGINPDTKKPCVNIIADSMITLAELFKEEPEATVTDLLSRPYHLTMKKEDPYKDLNFIGLIEGALKKADKAKDEFAARKEAGVKTDLTYVEEFRALVKKLRPESAPAVEPVSQEVHVH